VRTASERSSTTIVPLVGLPGSGWASENTVPVPSSTVRKLGLAPTLTFCRIWSVAVSMTATAFCRPSAT
jgi:hypothetical protein